MGSSVGIKMSQPGWDVRRAGDANTYFSSSWPWLKIDSEPVIGLTSTSGIINHTLNYPPFVMAWSNTRGLIMDSLTISSKKITIAGTAGENILCRIFRNPLNVSYKSDVVHAALVPEGTPDTSHGIKVSKPGKDVSSKDLRDFTIHSGTRSPLVHEVRFEKLGTIAGGDYSGIHGLKYASDLPYSPLYFVFYSADGDSFVCLNAASPTPPKINYDGIDSGNIKNIILNNGSTVGGYGCFFVFKDPFDAPNITKVTI